MTLRHAALASGAVLVLVLAVYLFIEVRAAPASARVGAPAIASPRADTGPTATPRAAASGHPAIDEETDEQPPIVAGPVRRHPEARVATVGAPGAAAGEPAEPRSSPLGAFVREGPGDRQLAVADPKVVAVMDEANKAYDHGDLDDAKTIALKVLAKTPGNPRMLRIVVSAACIAGDNAEAQRAYLQLPVADREQMKVRCARYGVTFNE